RSPAIAQPHPSSAGRGGARPAGIGAMSGGDSSDGLPPDGLPPDGLPWWRTGVLYQIYPWSFRDANGDGVGDLDGITRELDYVAELGVDAIWLSPIYCSPGVDFGYDVADHCDIDPRFGDLAA